MKKFALILFLMFNELAATETIEKYFGAATLIGLIATTGYCCKKWLSSSEYLAFLDMKKKIEDAGIVITVTEKTNWYGNIIITTTRTNYSSSKNMSCSEFCDWINQYENAEKKTANLWQAASLLSGAGTISFFLFMCIYLSDL